jgi:hypothetical protein
MNYIVDMEPIVMILGCQKYKDNLMRAIDRMRLPGYRVIGIVGTTEPTSFDGTILSLQVEDSYEFLPRKVQAGFRWIYTKYPNISGIFKTDDDIFFNDQNQLSTEILKHQHVPYWGIVVAHCGAGRVDVNRIINSCDDKTLRPTHPSANYCFGLGYWVSREALPLVCASSEYEDAFLEDVCMGHVLNKAGFFPKYVAIPYQERRRN